MYPIGSSFLTAVKANTRKYYRTGRITTTDGDISDFDQNDIVKSSGYITSQSCGSAAIELGTVYAAQMGIFEVSEANRKAKCLEIKAYDYMVRFERIFNGYETVGNAYDFMNLCASACKVKLEQSRETIEAMPNGTDGLSIYSDNDIETYRDVLYYVGQALGGFFVINRGSVKKFVSLVKMTPFW